MFFDKDQENEYFNAEFLKEIEELKKENDKHLAEIRKLQNEINHILSDLRLKSPFDD